MKPRLSLLAILAATTLAHAEPIEGVQPASLDQPRIYVSVRRTPAGPPLSVKVEDQQTAAIEAFLDTGASGVVISDKTAQALKIKHERTPAGQPVLFEDIGVGGSEEFKVSEPLFVSLAPYSSNTDGDNPGSYSKPTGPMRVQLKPPGGLLDMLVGGLDVAGMPVMQGKVMVMDCRPLAKLDKIKTSVVAPADRSIPRTVRSVPLTYVSFARFTTLKPAGAKGPVVVANPLIGPDPFNSTDRARPVVAKHKGKSVPLTMLLDTGAACSMISSKKAAELGVKYAQDGKTLLNVPTNEQFSLDVGGIGGSKRSSGFYIDVLTLPAKEGEPVVYAKAPVLICDITVTDAKTGQPFTLDGVFGMNFLTASASITGGLMPDLDKVVDSPFQFVVIDHARGVMGLK
jgi:hypothetical protein